MIEAMDHAKRKHLLTTYISKIASYDINNLIPQIDENYLVRSIEENYSSMQLRRGIRTLDEVAHFVRCIPLSKEEESNIWTSPDVMLAIRTG